MDFFDFFDFFGVYCITMHMFTTEYLSLNQCSEEKEKKSSLPFFLIVVANSYPFHVVSYALKNNKQQQNKNKSPSPGGDKCPE